MFVDFSTFRSLVDFFMLRRIECFQEKAIFLPRLIRGERGGQSISTTMVGEETEIKTLVSGFEYLVFLSHISSLFLTKSFNDQINQRFSW